MRRACYTRAIRPLTVPLPHVMMHWRLESPSAMQLLRHAAHVFILRIWREPRDVEDAPAIWRGRIEHVTTEESRYFSTLDEALIFIAQKLSADEENSPN